MHNNKYFNKEILDDKVSKLSEIRNSFSSKPKEFDNLAIPSV